MHYIFGIFRPLQKNNVCETFRPHGTPLEGSHTKCMKQPRSMRTREPSLNMCAGTSKVLQQRIRGGVLMYQLPRCLAVPTRRNHGNRSGYAFGATAWWTYLMALWSDAGEKTRSMSLKSLFAIPAAILQECPRARAGKCPTECFLSALLESVKCRFSKCRFSAELEKLEKNIQDGGQRRKINPTSLGLSAVVRE